MRVGGCRHDIVLMKGVCGSWRWLLFEGVKGTARAARRWARAGRPVVIDATPALDWLAQADTLGSPRGAWAQGYGPLSFSARTWTPGTPWRAVRCTDV
ncbi:hypothetical protein FQZ97_817950 [compost metagenome]